mgnify:CR=1 FL=1
MRVTYWRISSNMRMSNSLQEASSEPVANPVPLGRDSTVLISDSWRSNVFKHDGVRVSQSLAVASQEPETKRFVYDGRYSCAV